MTKALQLQTAAGAPVTAHDFGVGTPASLTAPLAIRLTNTGDQATLNLRVWLEQGLPSDGALRVTLAGIDVIGTPGAPTALPELAPGAFHSGTAQFLTPASGADSARLRGLTD